MESNQNLHISMLSEEEINSLLDELTKTNTSEKRNKGHKKNILSTKFWDTKKDICDKYVKNNCKSCPFFPLWIGLGNIKDTCNDTIKKYPEEAIRIVNEKNNTDYRMISLDTASNNSGYALYLAGKLSKYGVLTSVGDDPDTKINTMCKSLTDLLEEYKPGTIVIELTVVDRGTGTQRMLSEIVGAVRGWAACHKYDDGYPVEFIQYRPGTWRKLNCEENEKAPSKRKECKAWSVKKVHDMYDINVSDDISDAILIGQARINEAKTLFEDDEDEENIS